MADWDADRYHRLSDPQYEWGRRVLARLRAVPGEQILDLGCGTGRLTRELALAVSPGLVVGLDRSPAMLARASVAATTAPGPHDVGARAPVPQLVLGDGSHLPFADAFDAVFSAATFHWIADHAALFASIYRALSPGGRLVAQCGGGANLDRLLRRARGLMEDATYRDHFRGWSDPWTFAWVPETRARLEEAGFSMIEVTLEPEPTTLPDSPTYAEFLHTVCVRHHVARLPEPLRPGFLQALAAQAAEDTPAFTLDYWRLNISAVKPIGSERAA